jgi:hypothetical protein
MSKTGPKRNPPARERGGSGPDVNQPGKELERGQDQPKDEERARS